MPQVNPITPQQQLVTIEMIPSTSTVVAFGNGNLVKMVVDNLVVLFALSSGFGDDFINISNHYYDCTCYI